MIKVVNKQKSKWLIGVLLMCSHWAMAQQSNSLTLDNCLEMAKQNYPLIKQYTLIEKTKEYSIANAQKGYLPQFNVAGQATYQSDVTSKFQSHCPIWIIPTISKDQYRLYGEVSQSITDLFTVKDQKEYINANSEMETQKVEVELYKLRERINNLFFGILLIDAQLSKPNYLKKIFKAVSKKQT
jgi:outer membrane protein TolC